jgi:hypothetical protein
VTIEYFNITGATQTLCGHYSVSSSAFVAAGGYTQATCVIPGNLVRLTLTNPYTLLTRLLGSGVGAAVTIKAVSVMPVLA